MTHKKYFKLASDLAKTATCLRSKCGSIIVKNGEIIGQGVNTPPQNLESERRCDNEKDAYHKKVTDKTCCVHAEQRAIMDALRKNPEKLKGSTLYFIRLDKDDKLSFAGAPYCTICSKMALDTGISKFVLWHASGIKEYDTKEYNDLSFSYKE
ncbi:MAG: deaminase [Candidatus Gracilibacteria bacterium]|jgi:deoxycytidylate deaminase|nr:deaminase [Candidatus Gracilibacteria bacterium]